MTKSLININTVSDNSSWQREPRLESANYKPNWERQIVSATKRKSVNIPVSSILLWDGKCLIDLSKHQLATGQLRRNNKHCSHDGLEARLIDLCHAVIKRIVDPLPGINPFSKATAQQTRVWWAAKKIKYTQVEENDEANDSRYYQKTVVIMLNMFSLDWYILYFL